MFTGEMKKETDSTLDEGFLPFWTGEKEVPEMEFATTVEDELQEKIAGVSVISERATLEEYLLHHVVDSVFLAADMEPEEREELTEWLIEAGVTVHTKLIRISGKHSDRTVEKIGNYTVLTSGIRLTTGRQLFMKRLLDILGGLVGICFAGIATIIVGPVIYCQSPGPIFFSQERVGKNGRTFRIYKFRSMYMDAEERKAELLEQNELGGPVFKMKNDPRITPVGHFIRKYSIDELPQFFNVLKGDMSLVGTRPPTMDEYQQYESHHRGRLAFKPGITGLWQVSGRNNITDFEEIVDLDTEYIANWSIGEDIKILWKTVKLVFSGDGE
jgi:exopolysaccharide biosynthesis polyprenyl glycosylphosphotransferase